MTCDLLFNEHEAYVEPIHNQCDLLFLLSRINYLNIFHLCYIILLVFQQTTWWVILLAESAL